MPRYAPKMSQTDLRQLIFARAIENDYIEQYGPLDPMNPDMDRILHMLIGEELMEDVVKDWAKVDFSTENMSVEKEKVTTDGIPYIELSVGGDWESPLVAIIYFDGKTFRGFIPKNGNTYNHKEKSAFGNNDSDLEAAKKQFGYNPGPNDDYIDVEPDKTLTTAEIENRLEAKGTYTFSAKPVVSKASQKAQKQAKIEKTQDLTGPITKDMVYAVINLAAGGAYVEFELRSSRRTLTVDEANRLVGVPAILEKTQLSSSDTLLWYSPDGYYPIETQKVLEKAGFEKAPDNDLSMYVGARTVYIQMR